MNKLDFLQRTAEAGANWRVEVTDVMAMPQVREDGLRIVPYDRGFTTMGVYRMMLKRLPDDTAVFLKVRNWVDPEFDITLEDGVVELAISHGTAPFWIPLWWNSWFCALGTPYEFQPPTNLWPPRRFWPCLEYNGRWVKIGDECYECDK